jgi:predicted phosphoribosyltransferase
MFRNREDAARQLAARLAHRELQRPLVLAIPRGGVVLGGILARELGADLDVVLARKLRAPGHPELALGAIAEDGHVHLNEIARRFPGATPEYLEAEQRRQSAEIAQRRDLFRAVCPKAPLVDRSIIITDDGLATGSTMLAALEVLAAHRPHEVIVAVPVAAPSRLAVLEPLCDDIVCLLCPEDFRAVGEFYRDFRGVTDEEVLETLREFASPSPHPPEPAG